MIHPALILLARLRMRGALRKIGRTLRRPRGALLFAFGVLLFALMVVPGLLIDRPPPGFAIKDFWLFDAKALLVLWLLFAVTARGATGLVFSLPEVEFLFPGPFSRREVLGYKLAVVSLAPLGTAVLMPLFTARFALWWPATLLGVWWTFSFMQLSSVLVRLGFQWWSAQAPRWRVLCLSAGVALAAALAWQARGALAPGLDIAARLEIVAAAPLAGVALAPFEAFSRLLLAQSAGALAAWGGVALATNIAVVVSIMWLDANYLEASLAMSQRRYEWMERAKRGGAGFPTIGLRSRPRLRLPRFPRLAGAGSVAWRQALELLRTSARLLFILPAAIAMGAPVVLGGQQAVSVAVIGITVLIGFMMSAVMPMGLRTDLDHVDVLKTLPVRAGAIVSGSIASAVLYPTFVQLVVIALLSAIGGQWPTACTLAACFALPFNLLLVSADSVMVLVYPSTRQISAGDILVGARMMLVYVVKFVVLAAAVIAPAAYAFAVDMIVGPSLPLIVGGAVAILLLEGAAAVWLAAYLFGRFDPSLDSSGEP
jgi:hypothetical protein